VPLRVVRLERWPGASLASGDEITNDGVVIDDLVVLGSTFHTIAQADWRLKRYVQRWRSELVPARRRCQNGAGPENPRARLQPGTYILPSGRCGAPVAPGANMKRRQRWVADRRSRRQKNVLDLLYSLVRPRQLDLRLESTIRCPYLQEFLSSPRQSRRRHSFP